MFLSSLCWKLGFKPLLPKNMFWVKVGQRICFAPENCVLLQFVLETGFCCQMLSLCFINMCFYLKSQLWFQSKIVRHEVQLPLNYIHFHGLMKGCDLEQKMVQFGNKFFPCGSVTQKAFLGNRALKFGKNLFLTQPGLKSTFQ